MRTSLFLLLAVVLLVVSPGNAKFYPVEIIGRFVCKGKTTLTQLQLWDEGAGPNNEDLLMNETFRTSLEGPFNIKGGRKGSHPKPYLIIHHGCPAPGESLEPADRCTRIDLNYLVKSFLAEFELTDEDRLVYTKCVDYLRASPTLRG